MLSIDKTKSANQNNNYHTGKWTQEEDDNLVKLVKKYGMKRWKEISENMISRSPVQCLHRWTKILKPGLKKGSWTIEEDKKLLEWIRIEGPTKWSVCSEYIQGRSGKQCRERWFNTLNPNLKKGNWTPYEDYIICQQFKEYGSKWSKMSSFLPGRTENSIKNRFYSTLRRLASDMIKNSCLVQYNNNNTNINLNYNNLNSMTSLLFFFEIAYQEKKKAYEEYCNSYTNDLSPKQMTSTKYSMNSEGEEEDKDTFNKTNEIIFSRANSNPFQSHYDNNTYSVEENIRKANNIIKNDTQAIEKEIINYSCFDFQLNEPEIDKMQDSLNKLMKEYIATTEKGADGQAIDNFTSLYSQLNELEEYLLIAKKKVYQIQFPKEAMNDKMEEYYNDSKEEGERYYSLKFEHFI